MTDAEKALWREAISKGDDATLTALIDAWTKPAVETEEKGKADVKKK